MNTFKRLLIVVLIIMLPVQATAYFFNDVDNHWGEDYIYWATLDVPVFAGYPDDSFRPNRSISRAEFITMLRKVLDAAGQGAVSATSADLRFTDFSDQHWAYQHIQYINRYLQTAQQADLMVEDIFPDQRLRPDLPITRYEVALLTHSLTTPPARAPEGRAQFTDISVTDPHYTRIRELVDNGLISGYEDGTFRPNRFLTRAEAAVMAQKIFNDLMFLTPNRLTTSYPLIQNIYRYPTFDMPVNRHNYAALDRRMDHVIATLEYRSIVGFIPRDEQDLYDANPIQTLWELKNADYPSVIANNYYLLTHDRQLVPERKTELGTEALLAYLDLDDPGLDGFLLMAQTVGPYVSLDLKELTLKKYLTANLTELERIEASIRLAEILSEQNNTQEALRLFPALINQTTDYDMKILLIRNEIAIRNKYLGITDAVDQLKHYWDNIINEPRYWFYEEEVEAEFTTLMKQLLIQK